MTQTFDLNKMGLAPISDSELNEIDGGWAWWPIVVTYVLLEAALNPVAHINAFREGWNAIK